FEEAVWWTDGRAKYFEGIPAGDYILEELETPEGYLPASMEITVNPISELQSFVLKDDHTKLEILKYEEDENGNMIPLSWPQKAELALFPAVTVACGKPLQINGDFIYHHSPAIKWIIGPSMEFKKQLCTEYENMHRMYGSDFTSFSWSWEDDLGKHESYANLETFQPTSNEETILQEWRMEDQSLLRVTVGKNSGTGRTDDFGRTNLSFEYQFDYQKSENKEMPDMVSYELMNGIRRFDRIPEGTYILVETEVPDGYEKEAPLVVEVRETDAVQRFLMENRKKETEITGTLWIEKTDAGDTAQKLRGAKFEVKNLQSGEVYRLETDENGLAVLEGLPVKGVYESGIAGPCIYQIKEIAAPDGYRMNITTWNIRFVESGDNGLVHKLSVHDEKTRFCFQKKDFGTGYFLPGAIFSIYQAKIEDGRYVAYGEPLETWESDEKTHVAEGILSCGETYILVEEKAPDGYICCDPIRFTVSDDGTHMTNITDRLVQVQILYRDNTEEIESILIDGQAAKSTEYILENSRGERICMVGNGTPIIWSQEIEENRNRWHCGEGELLTLEEWIEFWDGSRICLERERFRAKEDFFRMPVSAGRYPKAVEYVLKNEQGIP
ncbi:MAG: hypothetical protein IJO13_04575, partial [Lachnospiraceae bacterium]|nr:hypothetical protein [Lachnospiraceae bacterium]